MKGKSAGERSLYLKLKLRCLRLLDWVPYYGNYVMQVAPLRPPTELAVITSGMDKPPPPTAKIPSVSVMRVADASTSLVRDLTDMLQIAPAAAATSLLLMIFDAIEVCVTCIR